MRTHRASLFLLPVTIALATQLAAQSAFASATAATQLHAHTASGTDDVLPAGSPITNVLLQSSVQTIDLYEVAEASFELEQTLEGVTYRIEDRADCYFSPPQFGAFASTGSHETVLRLAGPVGVHGMLRLRYTFLDAAGATAAGPNGATAEVDVGDDGSFEFAAPTADGSATLLLDLHSATPVAIRTRTSSFVAGNPTQPARGELTIEFVPRLVTANASALTTLIVGSTTAPAGTDLTGGITLSGGGIFGGSLQVSISNDWDHVEYSIYDFSGLGTTGAHDTLLQLRSGQSVDGVLAIEYNGTHASAEVDFDNDGTFDWTSNPGTTSTQTFELPRMLAGTLDVRTRTSSTAQSVSDLGSGSLKISFRPRSPLTATASALTTMVAQANTTYQTRPAGTDLTPGLDLVANATVPGPFGSAQVRARTEVDLQQDGFRIDYEIRESALLLSGAANATVRTGPHETLLQLHTPMPVAGLLGVELGYSFGADFAIDLGNDGGIDWALGMPPLWQETVLEDTTEIRTITGHSGPPYGSSSLGLTFLPLLHDNGPLVTDPGAAAGGADLSAVQNSTLGMTSTGYTAEADFGYWVGDDFGIADPAGWTIHAVEVLVYQPNWAGAASPVDELYVEVYDGDPNNGGIEVDGSDGTINLLTAGTLSNEMADVYRAYDTTPTDTARRLARVRAELPTPIALGPGVYWLRFSVSGDPAYTGPFVPPITVLGQSATGNLRDELDLPFLDGGTGASQGLPFRLYGTRRDGTSSIVATGPGCGAAELRLDGAPVLGGFLFAEMTNLTPGTIPLIGLDITGIPGGFPFCGCTLGHAWSIVTALGPTWQTEIPLSPDWHGIDVFAQGVEFGLSAVCPDLPLVLTDTWRARIR